MAETYEPGQIITKALEEFEQGINNRLAEFERRITLRLGAIVIVAGGIAVTLAKLL